MRKLNGITINGEYLGNSVVINGMFRAICTISPVIMRNFVQMLNKIGTLDKAVKINNFHCGHDNIDIEFENDNSKGNASLSFKLEDGEPILTESKLKINDDEYNCETGQIIKTANPNTQNPIHTNETEREQKKRELKERKIAEIKKKREQLMKQRREQQNNAEKSTTEASEKEEDLSKLSHQDIKEKKRQELIERRRKEIEARKAALNEQRGQNTPNNFESNEIPILETENNTTIPKTNIEENNTNGITNVSQGSDENIITSSTEKSNEIENPAVSSEDNNDRITAVNKDKEEQVKDDKNINTQDDMSIVEDEINFDKEIKAEDSFNEVDEFDNFNETSKDEDYFDKNKEDFEFETPKDADNFDNYNEYNNDELTEDDLAQIEAELKSEFGDDYNDIANFNSQSNNNDNFDSFEDFNNFNTKNDDYTSAALSSPDGKMYTIIAKSIKLEIAGAENLPESLQNFNTPSWNNYQQNTSDNPEENKTPDSNNYNIGQNYQYFNTPQPPWFDPNNPQQYPYPPYPPYPYPYPPPQEQHIPQDEAENSSTATEKPVKEEAEVEFNMVPQEEVKEEELMTLEEFKAEQEKRKNVVEKKLRQKFRIVGSKERINASALDGGVFVAGNKIYKWGDTLQLDG